jgi:cellulose biosynthesis protein BcsQ
MKSGRSRGTIVTFYSYKGGTGRTMALANVAWLLADMGCEVCVIDWDLEAPGVHRYFAPFLIDPGLESTPGVIDFAWMAAEQRVRTESSGAKSPEPSASLIEHAVTLDFDFASEGRLDLIGAGRQDATYGTRVTTFDWDDFYSRLSGGKVLEAAMEDLRAAYDFVLIDSRTGVSDTSGICTIQFPDTLVACYTLNRQSIEGVAKVVGRVKEQRDAEPRPIHVIAVEMRVETSEKDRLDAARRASRDQMAPFVGHRSRPLEVLYWPFYAFEECLAPFFDDLEHRSALQLLTAMEFLTEAISGESVVARVLDPVQRKEIADRFLFDPDTTRADTDVNVERLHTEVRLAFDKWLENPYPSYLLTSKLLDQLKLVPPPPRLANQPDFIEYKRLSERLVRFSRRATYPMTIVGALGGGVSGYFGTTSPMWWFFLVLVIAAALALFIIARRRIARPRSSRVTKSIRPGRSSLDDGDERPQSFRSTS